MPASRASLFVQRRSYRPGRLLNGKGYAVMQHNIPLQKICKNAFDVFTNLFLNYKITAMPTNKSLRTIKFILPLVAIIAAISVFAFSPGHVNITKKANDHYRFTLNNPLMASSSGYVSNVNNWSSDLVPVDEEDFQCQGGTEEACEIITPIGDVNTSTHKLKGSISETSGTASLYIVSGYTPTTGSASFNNRDQ